MGKEPVPVECAPQLRPLPVTPASPFPPLRQAHCCSNFFLFHQRSRPLVTCLLSLLVAAAAIVVTAASAGVAFAEDTTRVHHQPLLDCTPALASGGDASAFRANLASVLAALPSAPAAAPKGFATKHSDGTGRDRAFARGLCFGSSSSSACRACLSAASRDVARGCGAWRAGCFLAYADTEAASAREDAFRGWFYVAPTTTAAPDRACARCLDDSARAVAALRWPARISGEQVLVAGYACCLRVRISVLPRGPEPRRELLLP